MAYEGFVDPGLLDAQEDTGVWSARIEAAPEGSIWVWDQDGKVSGFVAVVPEAEGQPGVGFVQALYVDPVAQGAGVGSALHDRALERLREQGVGEATQWVLADYERGRTFLEKKGWEREPGVQDNDPTWDVECFRYRLRF